MSVRVLAASFSVWCEECRKWVGPSLSERALANRVANKHRREHKRAEVPPLTIHEAKATAEAAV